MLPELALPAEAFIRLVYGRLDPAHTPPVETRRADLDGLRQVFPGYLDAARALLATCPSQVEDGPTGLSPDFEALRWFPLPAASVAAYLKSQLSGEPGPAA